jgi:RecB family exonuclease
MSKAMRLSASNVKTFFQCGLKYYYRYKDKKPQESDRKSLALGIAVHEALEDIYALLYKESRNPTQKDYEYANDIFVKIAVKEGLAHESMYFTGQDIIKTHLDNFSLEDKVVSLEQRFELVTAKGTPFTGAIDKLVELDEDTIIVIDYKTSNTALTQEEADEDVQMSMYDLAIRMLYPQYKNVILVLHYIKLNDEVVTTRTEGQRKLFLDIIDALYERLSTMSDDEFKPNLNTFCGWCEYKNFCPEYERAVTDKDIKLPRLDSLTDEEFIDTWNQFQNVRRAVMSREDHMKEHIAARSQVGRKDIIRGKTQELFKHQTAKTEYNIRTLFRIVPTEHLPELVSVNKAAVDRYLKNNPDYKEELDDTSRSYYTSAYFRCRKIK